MIRDNLVAWTEELDAQKQRDRLKSVRDAVRSHPDAGDSSWLAAELAMSPQRPALCSGVQAVCQSPSRCSLPSTRPRKTISRLRKWKSEANKVQLFCPILFDAHCDGNPSS